MYVSHSAVHSGPKDSASLALLNNSRGIDISRCPYFNFHRLPAASLSLQSPPPPSVPFHVAQRARWSRGRRVRGDICHQRCMTVEDPRWKSTGQARSPPPIDLHLPDTVTDRANQPMTAPETARHSFTGETRWDESDWLTVCHRAAGAFPKSISAWQDSGVCVGGGGWRGARDARVCICVRVGGRPQTNCPLLLLTVWVTKRQAGRSSSGGLVHVVGRLGEVKATNRREAVRGGCQATIKEHTHTHTLTLALILSHAFSRGSPLRSDPSRSLLSPCHYSNTACHRR